MPPKQQYSREQVIDAALDVVREQGSKALSARKIAEKLGSSTAPVYQQYGSMSELTRDTLRRVCRAITDRGRESYTSQEFLNFGIGFVLFARDEPELFRALILEPHESRDLLESLQDVVIEKMQSVSAFSLLPYERRRSMLWRLSTFTIGLATQIVNGLIDDTDDEFIIEVMSEVNDAVMDAIAPGYERRAPGAAQS